MISYYRAYPSEFCKEYLGITLYPFQEVLLNELMWNNHVIEIMFRNAGKTTITALFLAVRCILYPGTQVIIVASSRRQAVESILKIKQFCNDSPMLRAEISLLSDSINTPKIYFHNSSTINIVTGDSSLSRGQRAHIVVVDEYAASELEQDFIQSVLLPMTGDYRRFKALTLPEYSTPEYDYLKEEPKEIYLSSAGRKSSWTYGYFTDFTKKMISNNKGYFTCALPYMTAIQCNLRTKSFYAEQMAKDNFNKSRGNAEYLSIWMQDSDDAFFPYESLDNIRKLRKAIYPKEINEFIMDKNKKYLNPKKPDGCIRIMGCDIALRKGSKNDASAYVIMQLIPKEKTIVSTDGNGNKTKIKIPYYERQLIYIETNNGWLVEKQVERIKKLYHDFDCDRIIIDSKSGGIGLIQELSKPTIDSTTGEDYPPFQSYNDEEMSEWCTYPMPLKTMYCMQASEKSNKDMSEGLQKVINNGSLQLLISENQVKDQLQLIKGYDDFPQTTRNKIELPYLETRLLIEEMSALELVSTMPFKLKEPSGGRKDRWSALLYCNGLADMLEAEIAKPKKKRSKGRFKYIPQEHFASKSKFI